MPEKNQQGATLFVAKNTALRWLTFLHLRARPYLSQNFWCFAAVLPPPNAPGVPNTPVPNLPGRGRGLGMAKWDSIPVLRRCAPSNGQIPYPRAIEELSPRFRIQSSRPALNTPPPRGPQREPPVRRPERGQTSTTS